MTLIWGKSRQGEASLYADCLSKGMYSRLNTALLRRGVDPSDATAAFQDSGREVAHDGPTRLSLE